MNREIHEVDQVDNKLNIISIDKGDDESPSSRSSNNNNNKMFKNNNNENSVVSMKDFLQVKDEIRQLNQKMDLLLQTIQNLDKSNNNGNNSFNNNNNNNNNYNKNNSRSHT